MFFSVINYCTIIHVQHCYKLAVCVSCILYYLYTTSLQAGAINELTLSVLNLPETLGQFWCVYSVAHLLDMSGGVIQPADRGMSERVNSSRTGVESVTCDWSDEVKEAFLDESEWGVCVCVCV